MSWKQWLVHFAIMGAVYAVGYYSSYFLSKKYAIKKRERDNDEKQK